MVSDCVIVCVMVCVCVAVWQCVASGWGDLLACVGLGEGGTTSCLSGWIFVPQQGGVAGQSVSANAP